MIYDLPRHSYWQKVSTANLNRRRGERLLLKSPKITHRSCHGFRVRAEDLDFVEKAFGFIFGKKALNNRTPFGLARMEGTALAQQYEANATDQADPVEGDSSQVASFRSVLANTVLETAALRQVFSSAQQGWNVRRFHQAVQNQGAAVVVAKTTQGTVFGGYNPFGWEGLGDSPESRAAFLFTWCGRKASETAIKLPKVGGPGLAIMDDPDSGPKFGAEGLSIPLRSDSPRAAYSRLGTFYEKLPDGSRSLFPEGSTAELADLQVYVAAD